jgi:DNA-binding MarR family transcriptional regulator
MYMIATADSLQRLCDAAAKATALLSAAGDDLVADLGLSAARVQILDVLAARGPRTVSQIARSLGLSRQAVQRVAGDLVAHRFATYANNPDHARAPLVTMTDQGRAAQAEAARRKALWRETLADGLTPTWLDMASELMTLIARRAGKNAHQTHS